MVMSVGRGPEQEAISYESWSGWLVDRDVPATRDDDDVAMKATTHAGSARSSGWPSGVPSASRRARTVSLSLSLSLSLPLAAGDGWAAVP
jgi:hypothetical protein